MNQFWAKIEEGLAGEFSFRALSPAFAFWGTGIVLWGYVNGWNKITQFLMGIDTTQAIALAVCLLFLLELTTWFGNWLKAPALILMEGYWKRWPLRSLRSKLTARVERKLANNRLRLDILAGKGNLDVDEKKEFKELEAETNQYPEEKEFLMPTRLGNLIRVAESYPYEIYGLEIHTIFPRLWLILPEGIQNELSESRMHLDNQVKMVLLGVALLFWTVISPVIIAVGIFVSIWGYLRALTAAEVYGLLLRSTFDLYRFDLYDQLHLSLPANPAEEIKLGVKVTQALARGFKENIKFKHPSK